MHLSQQHRLSWGFRQSSPLTLVFLHIHVQVPDVVLRGCDLLLKLLHPEGKIKTSCVVSDYVWAQAPSSIMEPSPTGAIHVTLRFAPSSQPRSYFICPCWSLSLFQPNSGPSSPWFTMHSLSVHGRHLLVVVLDLSKQLVPLLLWRPTCLLLLQQLVALYLQLVQLFVQTHWKQEHLRVLRRTTSAVPCSYRRIKKQQVV